MASQVFTGPVMLSLFNGRPFAPESPERLRSDEPVLLCAPPRLLVRLTPWHRVFFGNLFDALLFRREPQVVLTSSPADFWPDVFVDRRLPARPFWQSGLYHIFIVVAVCGFSQLWLMRPAKVLVRNTEHATITYYKVSEYLPPIISAESEPAKSARTGDPVYAQQKIVSIRPNAESRTQTVIAPPKIKLPGDVSIPNIVAWNPVPAPVPSVMAVHSAAQWNMVLVPVPPAPIVGHSAGLSQMPPPANVVPPAPTVDRNKLTVPADILARSVVPPAPTVGEAHQRVPNLPMPSAVEPPVSMNGLRPRVGELNMASVAVVPPAPKLSVAEQRATGSLTRGMDVAAIPPVPSTRDLTAAHRVGNSAASQASTVVPPPPSLQVLGQGRTTGAGGAGQLIALGINASAISGPINAPQGVRSGTFAAGPQGRAGAAGTPEIKGGGTKNGAGGTGIITGSDVAGITVERGATTPSGDVVVAGPAQLTKPAQDPRLLASIARPNIADLARGTRTQPATTAPSPRIEDEVFGRKKFYSMVLNMPNLNSRSGSWIVRFAELKANGYKGELSAPMALRKFDPAYPTDLIRDHVEGTVVLYAIIHSDGKVSDVRVLHGIDSRLDENARAALTKWQFRPGSKNGAAVDIEAVVQIPFFARAKF